MNTTKQQHAHALAAKAFGLYESGKQAEAFKVYRAAMAAGYKPPAVEEAEKRQREAIEAGALGLLVFVLAAAAIAARAGFFF
jgi:hypothetical protein